MGMVPDREPLREHTKSPAERTGEASKANGNVRGIDCNDCNDVMIQECIRHFRHERKMGRVSPYSELWECVVVCPNPKPKWFFYFFNVIVICVVSHFS